MAIPKIDEDIESILSKNNSWTTTYGDLMSALMILFLALFSFYITSNMGKESTMMSGKPEEGKESIKVEEFEETGGPLKKPYVEVFLKKPILLRYDKGDHKKAMKETMNQIEKEVLKAYNVNFVGDMNKPERKGVYPANWIRKVTINVSPDYDDDAEYYVVKEGDSLWSISQKYMINPILFEELARINNLEDATMIRPGDVLLIPKKPEIKEMRDARRKAPPIVEITSNIMKKLFKKQED